MISDTVKMSEEFRTRAHGLFQHQTVLSIKQLFHLTLFQKSLEVEELNSSCYIHVQLMFFAESLKIIIFLVFPFQEIEN